MVLPGLLAGIGRAYLAGAMTGWGKVSSYGQVGNFNLASVTGSSGSKAELELTDLAALERMLKLAAPDIFLKMKRDARKIGTPARNDVRDAFSKIGPGGPLGPRKVDPTKTWATQRANSRRIYDGFNTLNGDNGRLSWFNNYFQINSNKGVDVNYKNRNASRDLAKLKTGQDGQLSVVRVRVRKAPLILADMAGRGGRAMYSNGKMRTRPYQIDLFGRGIVTRSHRINTGNSDTFVENLKKARSTGSSQPSRYAYPAFIKHQPKFRRNVEALINQVVIDLNRRMESK